MQMWLQRSSLYKRHYEYLLIFLLRLQPRKKIQKKTKSGWVCSENMTDRKRSRKEKDSPPPYVISLSRQKVLTSEYELQDVIGRGVYGSVWRALHKTTQRPVAVKTFHKSAGGVDYTTDGMKEIHSLKLVGAHPNIINILDVCSDESRTLHMVMERAQHDLCGFMSQKSIIFAATSGMIKGYFQQLMLGLAHCHGRGIMHRDLKPENLLIMSDKSLRIADFGMAHPIEGPASGHRNPVTTQWYRAPEVYLGSTSYGAAIDIWSAACIFAQMLMEGHVLIKGECFDEQGKEESMLTRKAQMNAIWKLCGTPNAADWPKDLHDAIRHSFTARVNRDLPFALAEKNKTPRKLIFTTEAIKLLDAMLQLVPEKRPTAVRVLESAYFTKEKDAPYRTEELPRFNGHYFKK